MDYRFTAEPRMFREAVARFAREQLERYVPQMEETDRFPVDVFKKLGDLGYMGIHFPPEYGGSGADFTTFCIFMEETCKVSAAIGVNVLLHTLMGSAPIFLVGSEEQRRTYFVPAIAGEKIAAAGLT